MRQLVGIYSAQTPAPSLLKCYLSSWSRIWALGRLSLKQSLAYAAGSRQLVAAQVAASFVGRDENMKEQLWLCEPSSLVQGGT